MLSTITTTPPPRHPSPLPRRTDSLSASIAKPKLSSPLIQAREDAKCARIVLTATVTEDDKAGVKVDAEECERRHQDHDRVLTEMLDRMTGWVEELAALLQQAYKNQTELETALTLARSNLQLALANNEMLEEALKRGGGGGRDVGWRRWSEREGVRRSGSVKDYVQQEQPNSVADVPPQQQQQPPQTAPSRFFSFKASLQRISSTNTSPTATSASPPYASASASASASSSSLLPSITIPPTSRSTSPAPPHAPAMANAAASVPSSSRPSSPSPTSRDAQPPTSQLPTVSRSMSLSTQPTPREKELTALLNKERAALKALGDAKAQLEDELESLSQALFEEANKMVSKANRKLAETEEELRIATDQKEALRGALRIVEGENGTLRGVSASGREIDRGEEQNIARGADTYPSESMTVQHTQVPEEGTEGALPYNEDTPAVSYDLQEVPSHSHATEPLNPPHPAPAPDPQARSTIPSVTVTAAQRSASSSKSESSWSPATPLSDSRDVDGRDTSTSRSHPPISQPRPPSATSQTTPIQALSTDSPAPSASQSTSAHTPTPRLAQTDAHALARHRWSVLPATPGSRTAVRSEFENALRRMRELVEEVEDDGEDSDMTSDGVGDGLGREIVIEGEYLGEEKQDHGGAARLDGDANPWRA